MNNLLSYHELIDARISASEKDLPVPLYLKQISIYTSGAIIKDSNSHVYNSVV